MTDSMTEVLSIIFTVGVIGIPFLVAIICHEVAHGFVALRLGDTTARDAGRLTANPLKHFDLVGAAVFIVTMFSLGFGIGWAKPVPVDPERFSNIRQGIILVSAAGSAANFVLALLCSGLFFLLAPESGNEPASVAMTVVLILLQRSILINLFLGIFNLLPIPPLDGSKILAICLPYRYAVHYVKLERFGFMLVIIFVMAGGLDFLFSFIYDALAPALQTGL